MPSGIYPRLTVKSRFWDKVNKSGPVHPTLKTRCWLWTRSTMGGGYGQFSVKARSPLFAHRYSWEIHNGEIPNGLCVLHHCDNTRCVNPKHLFLGTRKDNSDDMVTKGRVSHVGCSKNPSKGEAHGRAKLTNQDVLEIRRLYGTGKFTKIGLARLFRVGRHQVYGIISHKYWSHI